MVATVDSPNGVARGYLPAARPRYRLVEFDDPEGGAPREESEPFRAEIHTNLTWGEIDELDAAVTIADVRRLVAPHVRAWNVLKLDAETGEPFAVAAPAEQGAGAFLALDGDLLMWLYDRVRFAWRESPVLGKGGGRPGSAPAPESSDD